MPAVVTKNSGFTTVEKNEGDLMTDFRRTAIRALTPYKPLAEIHRPSEDDSNRTFRTRLVVSWMLSNAALVFAVMNIAGKRARNEVDDPR